MSKNVIIKLVGGAALVVAGVVAGHFGGTFIGDGLVGLLKGGEEETDEVIEAEVVES
jgi:hypothetical protein